jgi:hypothetical protein
VPLQEPAHGLILELALKEKIAVYLVASTEAYSRLYQLNLRLYVQLNLLALLVQKVKVLTQKAIKSNISSPHEIF